MIAVDTNILVRLLTEDDRDQADRAEGLIVSQPTLIPKTVLLETEWVLRSSYRLSPRATRRALEKLLGLPTLMAEDQRARRQSLVLACGRL